MTSLIAAGGSGRSARVIPAVPAASSVTTIAFIRLSPLYPILASTACSVHRRGRMVLSDHDGQRRGSRLRSWWEPPQGFGEPARTLIDGLPARDREADPDPVEPGRPC